VLDDCSGSEQFVRLVEKFSVDQRYPSLIQILQSQSESQLAVDALRVLYSKGRFDLLSESLRSDDTESLEKILKTMAAAGDSRGNDLLLELLDDAKRPLSARRLAVKSLGATLEGAQRLVEIVQRPNSPVELRDAMAATIASARWPAILDAAAAIFPAQKSKDNGPLPPLNDLMLMSGDSARGKVIFGGGGGCAACHQPNDANKDVGPNLSNIGGKLTRQAIFESVLYPSAAINHNFETYQIVTADGLSVSGILVSETGTEVKLKDGAGIIRSVPVNTIEEKRKSDVSLMPANIQQQISTQELVDVVEYLTTLKGDLNPK
jgi:putative heme-binding domain-containing protein